MVKKEMNEKICRDCRKQIIGRRADAIICKDCRREAQAQSSQRIKEKEKEERIWRKVETSSVKTRIEHQKAQEILIKLENGPPEDEGELRWGLLHLLGLRKNNSSHYVFGDYGLVEDMETIEMKPFWEFIEKKVKERLEQEIIKIKMEQKNNRFMTKLNIIS